MKAALLLYQKVFPKLALVCSVLERYVYQPITEGFPIPMVSGNLSANFPLVELINSAVYKPRALSLPALEDGHINHKPSEMDAACANQSPWTLPGDQAQQSIEC